jgi:hypothetical protein
MSIRGIRKGWFPRIRDLLALVGIASLSGVANSTANDVTIARQQLELRVLEIRADIQNLAKDDPSAAFDTKLAWFNWGNWGNWNNWPNFPNWGNWFNR